MYDLAVKLIKKGKAYVCHQTAEEMKEGRNELKDSPYRNRSIEESLKLFLHMKEGRFEEGECTLRVKMNMQHPNPNMRDFVAYRIRYTPHPHSGDDWCIYPTYDYTHCIVDSLENVTHSLCSLEFEIRRESYFQLLNDLDLYKPNVWEFSRLNISNTVLSKRKIEKLVVEGAVHGWADPRLLTLEGLRRRGYTPSMINDFCGHLGTSRKGNENITSFKLLEKFARVELDRTAPRTFGVLEPLLLEIVNFEELEVREFEANIFPGDDSKGKQTYALKKHVYIEQDDFCETHSPNFFGLTPEKKVCLKYGPVIEFVSIHKKDSGEIDHVKVKVVPNYIQNLPANEAKKFKGFIHWVSKCHSMNATARLYSVLFLVEDLGSVKDKWQDHINPDSLAVKENCKIWNMHRNVAVESRFQFERMGYFILDQDSEPKKQKFIFNRIVELKESKEKQVNVAAAKK